MKRIWIVMIMAACVACSKQSNNTNNENKNESISFCADSAYAYIEAQMAFGPRVPNSAAHMQCAGWLADELRRYGAEVTVQTGVMPDYRGNEQKIYNIIGRFALPEHADRAHILLGAHYDTRPWCDEEPIHADRLYNVPGANDGASGVGVLLEIARQLGIRKADSALYTPVDIIFFDVEDMGTPSFYTGMERADTWCLGSQLWAMDYAQKRTPQYHFGIILDMVGDPKAVFPMEYYSSQYAEGFQQQIWRAAERLGHAKYFTRVQSYPIVDDHYYINRLAGIPCVDIIHYSSGSTTGFPAWWHTRQDDMQHISQQTLQAVGETVMKSL